MTAPLSRRRALTGAATVGVSIPVLAACGDDGGAGASDPASSDPAASTTPPSSPTEAGSAPRGGGSGLVATGDVPVGGGVVINKEELVVTQPTAGEFKAFSAICTHQGCLVGSVADGQIVCPCHDSTFSAEDGSVSGGPAGAPLEEVPVKVAGDQVVKA